MGLAAQNPGWTELRSGFGSIDKGLDYFLKPFAAFSH